MHLKTRIVISFVIMILIPIVLAAAACFGLLRLKLKEVEKKYQVQNATYGSLYDTPLMISHVMDDCMEYVEEQFQKNPSRFEDNAYLNQLNEQYAQDGIFLVIRENGTIYYNGSTTISDDTLLQTLPSESSLSDDEDITIYIRSLGQSMIKEMTLDMGSGREMELFVVAKVEKYVPEARQWIAETIMVILLVLIVAGFFTSKWIYKGMISPLRDLEKGTRSIRDGNLDFELKADSGIIEIDELTEDFNDMRARLKDSAEESLDTDKESKELISNISHDLKTPLTTIRGYAAGILDGVANTDEKMQRYVQTIYNKANDMNALIDELTLYSKIDTNRIPYNFAKVDVAEYFEDCVAELQPELQEKNIDLIYFNYMQEDAVIIADPEQLKRVVNNIVSNSVKYMDKQHGVINIRLRDVGDFVQVEIEDNGRGIPQKEVSRIFDRFYRTDTSRNNKIGGSGIGLSIVRKILEDHEGRVWATSKEGVGTVIYFVLRKHQSGESLPDSADT